MSRPIGVTPRTNVASVGSVFNDTRKVKALSLPETIKEKSTFGAKALFPLSFQVVREPLPRCYITIKNKTMHSRTRY